MEDPVNGTNIVDDAGLGSEHAEVAFSPDIALHLRGILQSILILSLFLCITSMIYLHSNRRIRKRIYGPLSSGINNTIMFMVDIGLVIVCLNQFGAITFHHVPCVIHSALSTSLTPICGTVFLLRAWVLAAQFARVHEQLRWMKLYLMSSKARTELETEPVTVSAKIDAWISSHPIVTSPQLLIPACIVFSIVIWVPSILIETVNQCDHDQPNPWNDFNAFVFFTLAIMVGAKLRGKLDTIGIRQELILVAIIFAVSQFLQTFVEMIGAKIELDPGGDPEELEDEYNVELGFSLWYLHGIMAVQLLILVVLVAVRPAVRVFLRRDGRASRKTNQQKLQEIFNDRRRKEEFQDFLGREFSMENLLFYDAIATLLVKSRQNLLMTNATSVAEMSQAIFDVYETFIAESGRFQVNLPSDECSQVGKCVNELKAGSGAPLPQQVAMVKTCIVAYSQSQTTIFNLMAADSLPRFLRETAPDGTTAAGSTAYNVVKSGVSTQVNVTVRRVDSKATPN